MEVVDCKLINFSIVVPLISVLVGCCCWPFYAYQAVF